MLPNIRNAMNFVEHASLDRSPFAFTQTWNRTIISGAICLAILVLSITCALLFMDPLMASGLMDNVYKPEGVVAGVVVCLVTYTVRDFLLAYRTDIVMNQRIAQANHWLSYGTYLIKSANGTESFGIGQALMLTSRAVDSPEGLHIICLALVDGTPLLIKARFDNACVVHGKGFNDTNTIRSMLEEAAGEWRYTVAEQIGIQFGPEATPSTEQAATPLRMRQRQQTGSGPLSTAGSLNLGNKVAQH